MRHDDARPRKRRRPPLRRKTVRWSAKEVDALLAGVRVHGVGKWAAILRHSPVFNGVRTSVDLKDKWRNLTSPVRAAALNNRDHSSKSTHPLVVQARASIDPICDLNPAEASSPDLSKTHSDQHQPDSHPNSDHNHPAPDDMHTPQNPCSQPILDSQPAQETPMSPVHSQEDVQKSLDDHAPEKQSGPKHYSNSDIASFSPLNRDSNTVKSLGPDHSHPKSLTKLEPKAIHSAARNPQVQPLQPPSESSVSPEVLSHPPQTPVPQSPQVILPQRLPHTQPQPSLHMNQYMHLSPHASASQLPTTAAPSQQQVAAMQQFMNQSLYQSAAVLADYWRRIGHDPTAYGMAVSAGGAIPPHLYPYYAARMGSLYNSDDDDDDDDDVDHISPILPIYPHPYSHQLKKSPLVPENKNPLFQSGLHGQTARAIASQHPRESANDKKVRKRPKTEQVTNECAGLANIERKRRPSGSTNEAVKQTTSASANACALGSKSIARGRIEDSPSKKSKGKRNVCSFDTIKKEMVDVSNTPAAEAISPEPDMAPSAAVEDCAKPVVEPDLKRSAERTGFDSVPDDVGYFPGEPFTTRSQRSTEQDGNENSEGDVADQGPMGMAPLCFPGLGVEEQRQFSVTDLV